VAGNVLNRCLPVATTADLFRLAGNVLEDVQGKIFEFLYDRIIQDSRFILKASKYFMIDLVVLYLLDHADRVTIYDIAGAQRSVRKNKAVHVVTILASSVENEAIRPRKSAGYQRRPLSSRVFSLCSCLMRDPASFFYKYFHRNSRPAQ
jgi:hypothetical protein